MFVGHIFLLYDLGFVFFCTLAGTGMSYVLLFGIRMMLFVKMMISLLAKKCPIYT